MGGGAQVTATIFATDGVDSDGQGPRPVQLVFRDHETWGRNGDGNVNVPEGSHDCGDSVPLPNHRHSDPRAREMEQTGFDEAAVLKKLGITYVHIPMRGSAENPYGPKALDTFAATSVSAQGKVLLHCTVAWRASHLWAAYLIRDRKVPVAADDPRRPAAALRRARADHGWRFDAS